MTNLFIFTFGIHSKNSDKFQPIVANDKRQAKSKMHELYGTNWSSCYTESEFEKSIEQGFFLNLKPLKTIFAKEAV